MNKTCVWILVALLGPLAGLTLAATAAPLPLDLLERPSGVADVTLSPSGSRLAVLYKGRESDGDLAVFEPRGGTLVELMSTRLPSPQSVATYTWLSDDYLALYYESPDQDFNQFAIADLSKRAINIQEPLTQIAKAPWGDADHILLSATGQDCRSRVVARCLVTLALRGGLRNRISDPLSLLGINFLAVSPTEIYASGRDSHGTQHDFVLNTGTRAWKEVEAGTVQRRRAALRRAAAQLPDDVLQREASAGMQGAVPVWTEPDHHLVGLMGHAPQRAFLALDPRLSGLQQLLEQKFPDDRVEITRLNPTLTRGMVRIWGPDQPPQYLLFNDAGGLSEYGQLAARVSPTMLGKTIIERDWAEGMPVAMTLPPEGVPLVGAVVEPLVAPAAAGEDPLDGYDGTRQAFAQMGIAVVRALTVMPAAFPSNAAGGEWRQMQADRFQHVVEHASDLVRGKPVCLLGAGTNGALALEWSGLPHVGCVAARGVRLDNQAFGQRVQMLEPSNRLAGVHISRSGVTGTPAIASVSFSISSAQLHREVPGLFGVPGSEHLADPAQWVATLPPKVMLAYDMKSRIEMEFAGESDRFRSAIRKAGKDLTFETEADPRTDNLQSQENLIRAMLGYVRDYFSAAAVAAH
ncbi:MAG: hypothetical protein ACREU2_18465 [Steroidobacteraceae bacterium]